MKNVSIVIPIYNEGGVIGDVIEEIRKHGDFSIFIIDDGSSDNTKNQVAQHNVYYLRHVINRGKGAAVKTGVMAAHRSGADVVVTMDGDGQHDPADIDTLIEPILSEGYDVVLGSRMLNHEGMPLLKVIANKIGNVITWIFYGIYVSDSQSGFRAYSEYAAGIIDTRADKYEYDSKVIREIKRNKLKFKEVPVHVRYTKYSMTKPQKQGFINGLKTLVRIIWDKLV